MKKMYIKHSYDKQKTAVTLSVTSYVANEQIAILLYNTDWEYYADLSVFVKPFEQKNYMAVDTNNLPTAEEFIQRYKLWKYVGFVYSGFCSYPVYEMNMERLEELI
jgi:hypothetical protein